MEKKVSVIVSVYNEEDNLNQFKKVTIPILESLSAIDWIFEVLFVNDGSKDKSSEILDAFSKEDSRLKTIHFSRNFGHEAAMLAGIDAAVGDFLICMDADLQNPPDLIPEILKQYIEGNDIILMARAENKDAGVIKKITSSLFYSILNRISKQEFEKNVSDFFGLSKRVANVLRNDYRERNRYLRGFVQHIGFKKKVIEYKATERFAGTSKYSIKQLIRLAILTLNCFSVTPLKAGVIASVISLGLMLMSFVYYIYFYINNGFGSGTALLCSFITFLFSILFILLGTIGEYLGMLMTEAKGRPIYIVMDTKNLDGTGGEQNV